MSRGENDEKTTAVVPADSAPGLRTEAVPAKNTLASFSSWLINLKRAGILPSSRIHRTETLVPQPSPLEDLKTSGGAPRGQGIAGAQRSEGKRRIYGPRRSRLEIKPPRRV